MTTEVVTRSAPSMKQPSFLWILRILLLTAPVPTGTREQCLIDQGPERRILIACNEYCCANATHRYCCPNCRHSVHQNQLCILNNPAIIGPILFFILLLFSIVGFLCCLLCDSAEQWLECPRIHGSQIHPCTDRSESGPAAPEGTAAPYPLVLIPPILLPTLPSYSASPPPPFESHPPEAIIVPTEGRSYEAERAPDQEEDSAALTFPCNTNNHQESSQDKSAR
ncbi:unnamed protein product [Dicrocoelium dendriticum]|nr:unnamed protein product [Dicrocoelium dendriticum]